MSSKMNSKSQRTQKKFQGQKDEESRSLLQYDGGDADANPEAAKDEEDAKKEEKPKSESKKSDKKADIGEEEKEVDDSHCCCKYPTAIMIYGIFLWLFGLLILFNACILFANIYFPWYYPLISLLLVLVYFAGLILIAIFWCKDVPETRTSLIIAGWLILGSMVLLILWNIFFILNHNKHKHQGVMVGSGDDPDDYDEEDRSTYLMGYILWGGVIIVLDILFLCCAINYADSFPPEDEEEEDMEKNKKKDDKKDKKDDKADDNKGGDDKGAEGGEANEGGSRERRSAASRSSKKSSTSKSQSTNKKSTSKKNK